MEKLEERIYEYLGAHQGESVEDILTLVRAESPSKDKAAVDACGAVLKGLYRERLGAEVREFPSETAGNHLCTAMGEGSEKILIVGHFDTVHPVGSFPVRQEGNLLYGPGVIDMKGGIAMVIWALKALRDCGVGFSKQIVIVNNGDEEIGSKTSKELILKEAKGCCACIIAEPSEPKTGRLKTCRKGLAKVTVRCFGKAAHSGNEPQAGINANIELAHQIIWLERLSDYEKGTTISVNLIGGGTTANSVSDRAEATADLRACEMAEMERIEALLSERKPCLLGAGTEFEVSVGRPPFPETAGGLKLYQMAEEAGEALGLKVEKGKISGGGSDGNFVSAAGIPTIDGMGADGDQQHTREEKLYLDRLVPKTALLALLLLRLLKSC